MSESLLRFSVAATVLLSVGLLTATLLKRRYGAIATTFLLRTTLVASLLAAVWSFVPLPRWNTPVTVYSFPSNVTPPTVSPEKTQTTKAGTNPSIRVTPPKTIAFRWDTILTGVFSLGSAANLACLLTGFVLLRRLRNNSNLMENSREEWKTLQETATALNVTAPELRECDKIATPFLAAVPQPVLFLPRSLSYTPIELRTTFAHELRHLQRGDLFWFFLARILCVPLWFHPLAYLLVRQLEHNAEEVCDEAPGEQGIATYEYADFLLRLSEQPETVPAFTLKIAPFRSSVGKRIARLLQARSSNRPLSRRGRGLVLSTAVACLVVAVSLIGRGTPGRAEQGLPQQTSELPVEEMLKRIAKPITVHAQNEEVVPLLKRIFEEAGLPYRIDSKIRGRVRVDLDKVPLLEAVRVIGKTATPRFTAMGSSQLIDVVPLPPTSSITGRVLYPDGRPAADVYVLVQIQNSENAVGVDWGDAKTNRNGVYTVSGLGPYHYNVAISVSDFRKNDPLAGATAKFVAPALEGVQVTLGKTNRLPDIRLTPGGIITGNVRDTAGNPIPKIIVGSYGPHRPESSAMIILTTADNSGRFQLRVAPGRSKIYISSPGYRQVHKYVDVREGETVETTLTTEKESPSAH